MSDVNGAVHQPRRGDEVEAWLKARRDQCEPHGEAWNALDDALDDYRLHSDTGAPLSITDTGGA